jgi:DNA helicase HerA-like ATPase
MSDRLLDIDTLGRLRLTANDFIGKNAAVLGLKGYGKSNTAAVLAEEFLKVGLPICIVDIKGEYWGLKERHNLYVIGQTVNPDPRAIDARITARSARAAATNSYTKAVSVILDVSGFSIEDREDFLSVYFQTLWELSSNPAYRHPYMIFIEEAKNFIPQGGKTAIKQLMINITCEGRSRGFGVVVIGTRSALIEKNVLTQSDYYFFHHASHELDVKRYMEHMNMVPSQAKIAIRKLKPGQCLLVVGDKTELQYIRLRTTPHKSHTPTMDDLPEVRGVESVQGLLI